MTLVNNIPVPGTGRPTPQLAEFQARLEEVAGHDLGDPGALHTFSVEHSGDFWRELLRWSQLPWSGSDEVAMIGDDVETAQFFPGVRLNYAEALLQPLPGVDDDLPALTSVHADRPAERWSRAELRAEVQRTAAALAGIGLRTGERVVIVGSNNGRTAIVALAAAALGAPLATATPDMGAGALLGRFEQVEPVLLVVDRTGMSDATLDGLLDGLPTLRRVVILDDRPLPPASVPVDRLDELPGTAEDSPVWERRPFDSPLFVMFSSGTTGPPKAMVHGVGGTLLEHIKEHRLHNDLRPDDVYFHHSTTAWMVWNRHLSSLASGAHVVVYDGSVQGPQTLWELVAAHGVTVFGTSPAYLQLCEDAGYRPADSVDLSRVRAVLSQGSVLENWQYDWVADAVGPVRLWSSSGGTDILGAFVLSHPELPVPRGRIQMRSLGMDVAAVDDEGRELIGQVGELVCRNAFPSRPLGFLRDPDGRRFHEAYFVQNPGMWTHGDRIDFDADGSSRLHGRSDGVLNIDGVRIGPSEIYTVLRGLPEIVDALAVEQRDPHRRGASRMVLLIVLKPGMQFSDGLARAIRRALRQELSAAHVPSLVAAVPELPLTHNGKRSERAARDALNGDPVANITALRNPDCLVAIQAAAAAPDVPLVEAPARADAKTEAAAVLDGARRPWCEVLDVREAEPEDHFFDLGGTSRQVMSLLRRVKLDLGVDVPLHEFLADPTLRGLAAAADRSRSAGTTDVPLLRAGIGRPVFVLADAWGQLNSYAALVEHLDTARPVHGIQVPLEHEGRRRTIPEVARDAVTRLRSVQSSGPYSLLGYSFGGLVAYEVATLLRAAGEEISYLGLIDVRPPLPALTPWEASARRWVGRTQTLFSSEGPAALARRLRLPAGHGSMAPEAEFFQGSYETANSWRPSPYAGPVFYYLAENRPPLVGNLLAAWRRLAPHLLVTEVPGHHGDHDDERPSVLSAQFAGLLAARISATLH